MRNVFDACRYIERGQVGEGWPLEIESFLGPVKWHRADRREPSKMILCCVMLYVLSPYQNFVGGKSLLYLPPAVPRSQNLPPPRGPANSRLTSLPVDIHAMLCDERNLQILF